MDARRDHRVALWSLAHSRLLAWASVGQLAGAGSLDPLATTCPWEPVSVWRWQARRQTRDQASRGAARASQSAASLVLRGALRAVAGRLGGL